MARYSGKDEVSCLRVFKVQELHLLVAEEGWTCENTQQLQDLDSVHISLDVSLQEEACPFTDIEWLSG